MNQTQLGQTSKGLAGLLIIFILDNPDEEKFLLLKQESLIHLKMNLYTRNMTQLLNFCSKYIAFVYIVLTLN